MAKPRTSKATQDPATGEQRKREALLHLIVQDLLVRGGWRGDGAREFIAMMKGLKSDPAPIAQSSYAKLKHLAPEEFVYALAKLPRRGRGGVKGRNSDLELLLKMIEPVILEGRPVTKVAREFARSAKGNSEDSSTLRLERGFRSLTKWKRERKPK